MAITEDERWGSFKISVNNCVYGLKYCEIYENSLLNVRGIIAYKKTKEEDLNHLNPQACSKSGRTFHIHSVHT